MHTHSPTRRSMLFNIMPSKKIAQHSTKKFAPNFYYIQSSVCFNSHFDGGKKIPKPTTTIATSAYKFINLLNATMCFILCNGFKPTIVQIQKLRKNICAGAYLRFHLSCCIPNIKNTTMHNDYGI